MLTNETQTTDAPTDQIVTEETPDQVFIPETTEQAEELYNKVMQPESEEAAVAQPEQTQEQQPAAPAAADEATHKINWNGEERDLPLSKILEFAQQGYDYNFKMRDLNKSQDAFKTQQQQFEEQQAALKEYQEVQDWAKQNPQLWDHAVKSFRQAQSGQPNTLEQGSADFSPQAMGVINGLNEKISQLESKVGKVEEVTQTQQQQAEDEALDTQIKGVMKRYPDWDWASRDENGYTLEDRTTQYAIDNGISNFEAAFKTANYDQLIERAKLSAKEQVGKTVAKQTQTAHAGVKPGLTNATDIRTKSYEDLTREALEELGMTDS